MFLFNKFVQLLPFVFISCSIYRSNLHRNVSLQNPTQIVKARSQLECILRCQRVRTENFFTDDKKCFCATATTKEGEKKFNGKLIKKVSIFIWMLPKRISVLWANYFICLKGGLNEGQNKIWRKGDFIPLWILFRLHHVSEWVFKNSLKC